MHVARAYALPHSAPGRWLILAMIAALLSLAEPPVAVTQAQSDSAASGSATASIVPESAFFYAYANLDPTTAQMQQAAELVDRAGLGTFMTEDTTGEIPAGAEVAVVVTSIPESTVPDVADVSIAMDPMAATENLDSGGYALIINADDVQSAYDMLLADLEANVDMSGGEITTSEYNGVTITSYEPAPDDDFTEPASIAMVGDFAVQAARAEDIHPLIDTAAGTNPAIDSNENYQTLTGMLPAEHLALGFVNGPAALEELQSSAPEVLPNLDEQTAQSLNSWTAFSFSAEENGFRAETRSIASSTPFDEIAPLDGSFLNQVPSDSVLVMNGTNIDSTGIVTTLALFVASSIVGEDMMATPIPGTSVFAGQDETFAAAESLLGFNLKTDFVDHLVGEFGLAISVSGSLADPASLPSVDAILFSELDEPVAVQDAVSKISFIINAALGEQASIETRDVNGSQVNVVDLTQTGVAEKAEFGVIDDQFVISTGTGLDDYLAAPESPLSEDPGFNAVMEHLPEEYGSVTYINLPIVIQLSTELSSTMTGAFPDADPSCAEYASQEDAQAAFEEDQFENFLLDQDFDGEACEDFFATPVASPDDAATNPYPNVMGLASVSTQEDGVNGTSTFVLIGGE